MTINYHNVQKKQAEVDKLNRLYEQLMSNVKVEHTGPLDATIYNIGKAITAKKEESVQLQLQWLRVQNDLVCSRTFYGVTNRSI